MTDGNSCDTTWQVNATGSADTTWEFFVTYASMNYSANVSDINTPTINITIINNIAPSVTAISLTPEYPLLTDDLNCIFTITDPSQLDVLTANVTWYKNNVSNISSVVSVVNGVQKSEILGSGNTSLDEEWHCGVTPYDQTTYGNQVNSSSVTIKSTKPPIINQIQCFRNNSIWTDCSNLVFHDIFSGVRANCTSELAIVTNVTFNLTNIPDSQTYFHNTITTNDSNWWEFYSNITMNNSGMFKVEVLCTDNNSEMDYDSVNWTLPFGTLVASLVDPNSNTNVEKNAFFTFTANVECVGGECGYVNATLDPEKGAISTTKGDTPFYTTDANPQDYHNESCLGNMIDGNLCQVSWQVNATGEQNTTYEFYAIFNMTTNKAYVSDNETEHINITITDSSIVPPYVKLESPPYNNVTNSSTVVFNCSATDNKGLSNMTLYGDFNGTFQENGSNSISGISNSTTFSRTLPDGVFIWNCLAYDNDGNYDWGNSNMTLTVDTTKPSISLEYPDNDNFTTDTITFNFTVTDNIDSQLKCNLTINSTVKDQNFNANNGSITSRTISSLAQGYYLWNVICWDDADNINTSETSNFTIIDLPPTVILITTDNIFQQSTNINLQYNASDNNNVTLARLLINGALNDTKTDPIDGAIETFSVTGLGEGKYNWTVNVSDVSGLSAQATEKWFTIDYTDPVINLTGPEDNFSTNLSSIYFNYTVTDNLDSWLLCNITINSNVKDNNYSAQNGSPISRLITDLEDGISYWNVTCFDDAGNSNISETRLINISAFPTVELNLPDEGHSQNSSELNFYYTPTDNSGFSGCNLIINDILNQTNSTSIMNGAQNNFTLTDLGSGYYNWTVNCTDILGLSAVASPVRKFTIDFVKPTITLYNPLPNETIYSQTITFNYSVVDDRDQNLVCNLSLDGFVNESNIPSPNGSYVNRTIVTGTDGVHYWDVTCWDDSGNTNTSETRNFTSMIPPTVTLYEPIPNAILDYRFNVTFRYTSYDANGLANSSLIINGIINQTDYNPNNGDYDNYFYVNFTNDGVYTWTVNATDTNGMEGTATARSLTIDTTPPNITINHPYNGENITSNNVTFNFTVTDNLDNELICNITINDVVEYQNINVDNGSTVIRYKIMYDGSYNWSVSCIDDANNTNVTSTRNFNVSVVPNVTIGNPQNQSWKSHSNITFYFNVSDNDGFTNCSLLLNGAVNNTISSGIVNNAENSINSTLGEGSFNWSVQCYDSGAYKNLGTSLKKEIYVDLNPPAIVLYAPENGITLSNNSPVFNFTTIDSISQNMNCNLTLDNKINISNITINNGSEHIESLYNLGIGMHYWNVTCIDYVNLTNTSVTWNFTILRADLTLNDSDISFIYNTANPEEGKQITINATIHNIGSSAANNAIVQFYDGDPDSGGVQIDINKTISINPNSYGYVSANWTATLGMHNIFVIVDPPLASNGSIAEENETNNKANKTIMVQSWHYVYGNLTGELGLRNQGNLSVYLWNVTDANNSNIFASDYDNDVNWTSLNAISRNTANGYVANDFSDIDNALSMSSYSDSVNNTYTINEQPVATSSFLVYGNNVTNVPVANSTNNSNFATGILWDFSDGNSEYNGSQDLVFITQTNVAKQGKYGICDYELRIPSNLKSYKGTTQSVALYIEIK